MGDLKIDRLGGDCFPKMSQVLRQGVDEGVAPGFVAGLWQKSSPEIIRLGAFGKRRTFPTKEHLSVDTWFDLASVSKVMATSTLAAVLVERGWIDWTTPVCQSSKGVIRLDHLLSHSSGLPAWLPHYEAVQKACAPEVLFEVDVGTRQKLMRQINAQVEPDAVPGERVEYSDIGFMRLGFFLEDVCGMSLDQAVTRMVWDPLGVEGARYIPTTTDPRYSARNRSGVEIAATEYCPWRGSFIEGQVHDENCWSMGGIAGHAGVFGRGVDVLTFAARLFQGALVTKKTLKEMWMRAPLPRGTDRTLGWDTPSAKGSTVGESMSRNSVGHWGFSGTSLWIDPEREIAVTLLSNRIHPTRDNVKIKELRPRFHDTLIEDLT